MAAEPEDIAGVEGGMTDTQEKVARAISRKRADCIAQGIYADSQLGHEFLAKAAIEAHEQALEEQGLVIVPREPTNRMIEELYGEFIGSIAHQARIDGYKDMLAALEGKE